LTIRYLSLRIAAVVAIAGIAACQSPIGVPTATVAGPDANGPPATAPAGAGPGEGSQLPQPAVDPALDPTRDPVVAPGQLATDRLRLTSVTPSPLAPSLVAIGSGAVSGFDAGRAVDGNPDTEWKSTGTNPVLTLDRGGAGPLTALSVKTNPNQVFALAVSDDQVTWKAVLANQRNTTWNIERKPFPAGTSGRYVRLAFTSAATVMVFEATPEGALTSNPTPAPTAAPSLSPTGAPATAPAPIAGYVQTRFGNQSVPRSADGTHTRGYQLISDLGMDTIREG